ncbi:hypothetical protein DSO57_1021265 [Entomophthora muscae]|uniref:Uncharacterized protein n=1 Tax=Entomophthora muscae TaxID=34485 RepID=A0ACC2RI34_9FUNG|nr:hypothetical protein DSO57_1021265 [Entomophthora muscae]
MEMKVASFILVGLAAAQCPVRREFRELRQDEQQIYLEAIQQLHQTPMSYQGGKTMFEYFTKIHMNFHSAIHGTALFLPWHREFTHMYEQELRKIDPRVVLPYWDWSLDSAEPHRSRVLDMMGGNGDYRNNYCVTQGPFANWNVSHPQPHCLRRSFDTGQRISPFASTESISLDCNEPTFSDFAMRFEIKHGNPHVSIGGNYGDFSTMHSPNDPLFFMHHVFVDMVWAEWQQRNPSAPFEGSRFGQQINEDTVLPFFNIAIRDTLDTSRYCYSYDRFPRNVQAQQLPPNVQNSVNTFSRENPFLGRWGRQRLSSLLGSRGRGFPRTRLNIPGLNSVFKQKKRNPPS